MSYVGLVTAAVGAVSSGVKAVSGAVKAKKARESGGPSLTDPNKAALINLMQRQRRAIESGTSDVGARGELGKTSKLMTKRTLLAGGRSVAPLRQLYRDTEAGIAAGSGEKSMNLLGHIVQGTGEQADRSMDLIGLKQQKDETQAAANRSVGGKNLFASGSELANILASRNADEPKAINADPAAESTEKKKKGFNVNALGQLVKGIGGMFGKGGGGGGDIGGGIGDIGVGFGDAMTVGTTSAPQ